MSGTSVDKVVQSLQQGAYAAAIEDAQRALQSEPENPELYELLAAAYYESGLFDKCAETLRAQIERTPDSAQGYGNLGQLLADMGKLDEAIPYAERAVALAPDSAQAKLALGNVYRAAGQAEHAQQQYQQAVAIEPENPVIRFNLGALFASLRQYDEAEKQLAKVIALAPDFVEAINHYAVVLKTLRRPKEAIEWFQSSLRIEPGRADTLNNLGTCWMDLNDPKRAKEMFERALAIDPSYTGAYVNLAALAEDEDELSLALNYYTQASATDPNNATIQTNLGALYLRLGDPDQAFDAFQSALRQEPQSAFAHAGLADTQRVRGDLSAATAELNKAIALAPDDGYVFEVKARIHEQKAELDLAEDTYQQAIVLAPERSSPRLALALFYTRLGEFQKAEAMFHSLANVQDSNVLLNWAAMEEKRNHLTRARELLAQAQTQSVKHNAAANLFASRLYLREKLFDQALEVLDESDPDAIQKLALRKDLFFQKGQVLDKMERYDEAFECFSVANGLVKQSLGRKTAKPLWDAYPGYEETWSRINGPERDESSKPGPIFIVGLPRSGTTLLEQIISSHADVSAGDELTIIYELVDGEAQRILGAERDYPACLLGSQASDWAKLREYYLRRARKLVPGATRFFTDKMPLNLTQLGLIHLMFPGAPIIHIVRHPLDTCLSTFSSNFTHLPFACDLIQIAHQYVRSIQLAEFYNKQFDLRYTVLRYEDLLRDLEKSSRAVLDHIGLSWDPTCLKYFDNQRVANTESYAQVREAIYTSSRYRYKNYIKHLQSIIPILKPVITHLGYEIEI